jgi:hypothetical protein
MQTVPPFSSPVSELRDYIREFAAECRVSKWFRALLHVRVVDQIANDIEANRAKIEAEAHVAEVADTEADRLLLEVLADGIVSEAEVEQVRTAQRLIRQSATADQNVGQLARA